MRYFAKVTISGVYELESTNLKDAEKELADSFAYDDESFEVKETIFEILENYDEEEK